jgi:hypothetical protein
MTGVAFGEAGIGVDSGVWSTAAEHGFRRPTLSRLVLYANETLLINNSYASTVETPRLQWCICM